MRTAKDRIIVALDVDSVVKARELVRLLAPHVGMFKIGLELCTAIGAPQAVDVVRANGGEVFLDLKFHDIPNTMAGAAKAAAGLGVKMFTVHAAAGVEGMKTAVAEGGNARVIAVTVLTSFDDAQSVAVYGRPVREQVIALSNAAFDEAGVGGLVCSPHELRMFKQCCYRYDHALFITPGVRPEWARSNDQQRVLTPAEAVAQEADYLVIGRPITQPPARIGGPLEAVRRITEEIEEATK